MTNTNNKSKEQLEKLTTKRLLAYYKAERKRLIRFKNSHTCECCGETDWDLTCRDKSWINHTEQDDVKKRIQMLGRQYFDKLIYLDMIKEILNKREHVEK
jgi:hypothetical protein